MKKILSLLALIVCVSTFAQTEINWVTLEEAVELQKKQPKKIIMDVYTKWCGPCKMLDKNTFHNKDVVKYINENYYAVKFNAEGNQEVTYQDKTFKNPNYDPAKANRRNSPHELSRALGVRSYPTLMFFDEEAKVISPIIGYKTPKQLELYLKMFAKDEYKKLKTQEEFNKYYEAFNYEFKG